jgi:hypothetical protein
MLHKIEPPLPQLETIVFSMFISHCAQFIFRIEPLYLNTIKSLGQSWLVPNLNNCAVDFLTLTLVWIIVLLKMSSRMAIACARGKEHAVALSVDFIGAAAARQSGRSLSPLSSSWVSSFRGKRVQLGATADWIKPTPRARCVCPASNGIAGSSDNWG